MNVYDQLAAAIYFLASESPKGILMPDLKGKFSVFHTRQNHVNNTESEILRGNGEKPLPITHKLGENFNLNSSYFFKLNRLHQ
jgi:hypothetical protein